MCVCAFLGMQTQIGLILVLEGYVFHYILVKNTFLGQLLHILTFYFNIFV